MICDAVRRRKIAFGLIAQFSTVLSSLGTQNHLIQPLGKRTSPIGSSWFSISILTLKIAISLARQSHRARHPIWEATCPPHICSGIHGMEIESQVVKDNDLNLEYGLKYEKVPRAKCKSPRIYLWGWIWGSVADILAAQSLEPKPLDLVNIEYWWMVSGRFWKGGTRWDLKIEIYKNDPLFSALMIFDSLSVLSVTMAGACRANGGLCRRQAPDSCCSCWSWSWLTLAISSLTAVRSGETQALVPGCPVLLRGCGFWCRIGLSQR